MECLVVTANKTGGGADKEKTTQKNTGRDTWLATATAAGESVADTGDSAIRKQPPAKKHQAYIVPPRSCALSVTRAAPHHTTTNTAANTNAP